jgi:hypothetical protein
VGGQNEWWGSREVARAWNMPLVGRNARRGWSEAVAGRNERWEIETGSLGWEHTLGG